MSKLIILQGIPGSGKSTWARSYLKKYGSSNTVIVNRDSIRSMLGDYWVPSREGLVTTIEDEMIIASVAKHYDVIIDATNLNDVTIARWELIAENTNADIEYVKFPINPYIAWFRDIKRWIFGGKRVGKKVIFSFYNRYKDKLK